MKSVRMLQLSALLVAVVAVPNATAESIGPTSIAQVAAACDSAEEALENLKDASQSGDVERTRAALTFYLRSFSEFHTKLARLRSERAETAFLKALSPRLNSQISATKTLAESAQPELGAVLNEATNQLRSAIELLDLTVNKKRGPSFKRSIYGPESTNPGARSWPPYLTFGGVEPQFRSIR